MAQIKRIKLLRKEISLENKENSINNIYRLDGRYAGTSGKILA